MNESKRERSVREESHMAVREESHMALRLSRGKKSTQHSLIRGSLLQPELPLSCNASTRGACSAQRTEPKPEESEVVNILTQLREAVRYPLKADVIFTWQERGIHSNGAGVTRDMSTKGVFVYSMDLPPRNAQIEMDVALPPVRDEAPTVRIHVRGRIVRTEIHTMNSANDGFAVTSKSTILCGRGVSEDANC